MQKDPQAFNFCPFIKEKDLHEIISFSRGVSKFLFFSSVFFYLRTESRAPEWPRVAGAVPRPAAAPAQMTTPEPCSFSSLSLTRPLSLPLPLSIPARDRNPSSGIRARRQRYAASRAPPSCSLDSPFSPLPHRALGASRQAPKPCNFSPSSSTAAGDIGRFRRVPSSPSPADPSIILPSSR